VTEDGFRIVPDALDRAEIERIEGAVAEAAFRSRGGARNLLTIPVIHAVARDHPLTQIAARVLGGTAVPFRATLFDKSPRANWLVAWHQDTALPLRTRHDRPGWGPWSQKAGVLHAHAPAAALERVVALRLHLDDSTAENGPLRVLPASHQRGVLSDAAIDEMRACVPPVECLVGRGGVLVMRPLLVHASSKSRGVQPRRVIHIEYASTLEIEPGVWLATA